VEVTAVNSLILLASGGLLALAGRAFAGPGDARRGRRLFLASLALGVAFVLLQGSEWARLIRFGLTMRSSTFGSFFYLIVGAHALHAVAALAALGHAYRRLGRGGLPLPAFWAISLFWYFVVAIWPVLYVLVYLA
jgi:heme/copper-type cytochrome/quinol oxidase subunit 3